MFLDEVTLEVVAGAGGRGAVSFRREKYVPRGGPDGGDGGRGGSVVLTVEPSESSLGRYRERRRFRAPDGRPGGGTQRSGADGADLVLPVPAGTVVTDAEDGEVIGDLARPGERLVVAAGGRGGRGNVHFASAARQAPRVGELGDPGGGRRIRLELKLIADVGLVGLPNAGKSTLLAALTGARPKVAAYPFTTLHPNLGVAELEGGRTLILADVPGLIEGAHLGAGLGTEFLRHLERTRVLIHVVDCAAGAAEARGALRQVEGELRAFSLQLAARPTLLALNKVDLAGGAAAAAELAAELPRAHSISAAGRIGTQALLVAAAELAAEARRAAAVTSPEPDPATGGGHRVYRHVPSPPAAPPHVEREPDGAYRVSGATIERLVERTDLDEDEAVAILQRRMAAAGVDAALAAAGCRDGDTVRIGSAEFSYRADPAVPPPRTARRAR
ncbi:MAG: GTPase ObgE [Candidatus Dormibacteria bacterium]